VRGPKSKLHQNLPRTCGDVRANFIKLGAAVLISISPPHTNRQTSVRPFIYIDRLIIVIIKELLTYFKYELRQVYFVLDELFILV